MAKSSSASGAVTMVAKRYALALMAAAEQANVLSQVHENMAVFNGFLAESAQLARLINNPLCDEKSCERVIQELCDRAGFTQITRNYLKVLTANRRLGQFSAIFAAFEHEMAKRNGWEEVLVTSAIPLTHEQQSQLLEVLGRQFGKQIRLKTLVDQSILGGLVITAGSNMYDDSLAKKLSNLKKSLHSNSNQNTHSQLKKVG